ncbi:YbaB/EbfC family nucleoid-associated protein [Patescibacteria group bacterium]|nr:YbaB/EbfC family nucleoid-associated protein [Patescibacteria group bacterium]MBU0777159.1 YbaB/EbfC family nucleoid-associated protein [Patescibacteria group bacterium]MBU0845853.1 YbaB/EbfC family nucleoid-associated protein [Patescibacteria group bacterium]MBU0922880.1 YbaB/EbfC family nucleoid-associated protein [Patescibacteria group bacterium]MBU1066387.1 YbaB/EbfC family nucleoid-associated protein [Patescibacteria group bacterium]
MAFDKVKQLGELNKMRQQAKELQKELEQITETLSAGDIEVKVTGDQKLAYMKVDGEERQDIVDAINKAMKKVQKKAAKKMLEMGGGLSGLLGKM